MRMNKIGAESGVIPIPLLPEEGTEADRERVLRGDLMEPEEARDGVPAKEILSRGTNRP